MTVNFTRDIKSSLITVVPLVKAVIVIVCLREYVGCKVVALQKLIFLHLLKQLKLVRLEF
jgi:hypothetical protein